MKKIFLSIITIGMLSACGGSDEKKSEDKGSTDKENNTEEACVYSYDAEATEINWVAYKFNEPDKTGVPGKVTNFTIVTTGEESSPENILKGASFVVEFSEGSFDSNDPDRDGKILNSFFMAMTDGLSLKGEIVEVEGDATGGTAVMSIAFNGLLHDVEGGYKVEGEKITLSFAFDFTNWDGAVALQALNEVCKERHTGNDGESVLWPYVDVTVSTVLKKECK